MTPSPLGTLGELAERTGGRVVGDAGVRIERIAAVDEADPTALTFAVDERYLRAAMSSKAAAVLTDEALVVAGESYPKPILAVPSARRSTVASAENRRPSQLHAPTPQPSVRPSRFIEPMPGVRCAQPNLSAPVRKHSTR